MSFESLAALSHGGVSAAESLGADGPPTVGLCGQTFEKLATPLSNASAPRTPKSKRLPKRNELWGENSHGPDTRGVSKKRSGQGVVGGRGS